MAALSAQVLKGLVKELKELENKPEDGIRVIINEDNVTDVQAELDGPAGTPYEGGVFRMKFALGQDFPEAPPKGFFITRIFHPNVSKAGEICVNVLKKDWKPSLGLRHVLLVIRCLLIQPFPDSALNEEAGKLLLEDYEGYARHARLMTSIHAQPAKRPMPLTAAGGANAVNSSAGASAGAGGDAAVAGSGGVDGSGGSPALKKAKGEGKSKPKAAAKSKSLKRL